MNLIADFNSYMNIKTSVALHNEVILLIFRIPSYSKNTLSKITFEPIPDIKNMALALNSHTILTDHNGKMYEPFLQDNLKKKI